MPGTKAHGDVALGGQNEGNAGIQTGECLRPTTDIARGRPGSKGCCMLVMLHALLLLTVMLEARVFSSSVSHEEEEIHEAFSGLLRLPIAGVISATVVFLHQ
jgi:hypothetical protein